MIGRIYEEIARAVLAAQKKERKEVDQLLATKDFIEIDKVVQADDYIGEAVRSLRDSLGAMSIVLPHGFTDYVKLGGMFDIETLTEETMALKSEIKAKTALIALMAMYERTARKSGKGNPWRDVKFEEVWIYLMYLTPILEALRMTVSTDLIRDAWDDYWAD